MLLRKSNNLLGSIAIVTTSSLYQSYYKFSSFTSVCDNEPLVITNKPTIKLYQYQICPFCNRVKAYLDFLKIDYESIEVNPITKSELKFSKEYKKVPIAKINDELVTDSQAIINKITSFIKLDDKASEDFFTSDTVKWNEWSEKKLALYLYPNITRSFNESWETFGYSMNVPTWSTLERYYVRALGSGFMLLANGKIKKKYNIVDERKELQNELKVWVDALGSNKFLHGDKITMPDILVFGVLRSINGLQSFKEIMNNNPTLEKWYLRVDGIVRTK